MNGRGKKIAERRETKAVRGLGVVETAAAAATATPLLVKLAQWVKNINVKALFSKVKDKIPALLKKNVDKIRDMRNNTADTPTTQAKQQGTSDYVDTQAMQDSVNPNSDSKLPIIPILIGGGALAFLLMKK